MIDILQIKPHVVSKKTPRTFLFYGDPGTYKTTVAAKFPKSLILAADVGYGFIDGVKPANIVSWADLKSAKRQLMQPMAKEMYETVVLDGIHLMYDMCESYVTTEKQVKELSDIPWGGGHSRRRKEFTEVITSIIQSGYNVVFICHAEVVEGTDEKPGRIGPKLPQAAASMLYGNCDFVCYCRKEISEENPNVITSYLYTNASANVLTKRRLLIKDKFEFTYENLMDALQEGLDNLESSGVVISQEEVNINEKKEENLESLKQSVTEVASILIEHPVAVNETTQIVNSVLGCKISEVVPGQEPALQIVLQQLLDLKEQYKL